MSRKINTWWTSFSEIFKESGIYSINRVLPGILFFLSNISFWVIVSVMFFCGIVFNAFGELVTVYLSIQTLIAGWLTGNKFTNSKYNTEPGALGKPVNVVNTTVANDTENKQSEVRHPGNSNTTLMR